MFDATGREIASIVSEELSAETTHGNGMQKVFQAASIFIAYKQDHFPKPGSSFWAGKAIAGYLLTTTLFLLEKIIDVAQHFCSRDFF